MNETITELSESAYLAAPNLLDALFEFGSPELIANYKLASRKIEFNRQPPKNGILGIIQEAGSALQEFQNNKYDREKALAGLKADILRFIKKSELIAFGYQEPRNIKHQPIKIPADLFLSGEINWDNSELKHKALEFSGIRLFKISFSSINPTAEIEPIPNHPAITKFEILDFSNLSPDRYINEKQAAEFLGISVKTLQGYRVKGGGPEFRKFGAKTVRYKFSDLKNWAENRKKKNTSE